MHQQFGGLHSYRSFFWMGAEEAKPVPTADSQATPIHDCAFDADRWQIRRETVRSGHRMDRFRTPVAFDAWSNDCSGAAIAEDFQANLRSKPRPIEGIPSWHSLCDRATGSIAGLSGTNHDHTQSN
jgi:hypothetical protein